MIEREKGVATSLCPSALEQTRQRVELRFKAMQAAINVRVKLR